MPEPPAPSSGSTVQGEPGGEPAWRWVGAGCAAETQAGEGLAGVSEPRRMGVPEEVTWEQNPMGRVSWAHVRSGGRAASPLGPGASGLPG